MAATDIACSFWERPSRCCVGLLPLPHSKMSSIPGANASAALSGFVQGCNCSDCSRLMAR